MQTNDTDRMDNSIFFTLPDVTKMSCRSSRTWLTAREKAITADGHVKAPWRKPQQKVTSFRVTMATTHAGRQRACIVKFRKIRMGHVSIHPCMLWES